MTEEFNKWWGKDELSSENLYYKDSPAYWAWEGWQAGVKAEREMCAAVCDKLGDEYADTNAAHCAFAIRERGAP